MLPDFSIEDDLVSVPADIHPGADRSLERIIRSKISEEDVELGVMFANLDEEASQQLHARAQRVTQNWCADACRWG